MMKFTRISWRFYCNSVLGMIKINNLFQEDDFLNCQLIFDQCFPLLISTDDSNNSHQRKMYSKWPKPKSGPKLLWLILLWLYSQFLWIHERHLSILYGVALLGLYSVSGKTSYRKISKSLEAVRFEFRLLQSFWNLTDTFATALPRCLSNLRAIQRSEHPISRLRDYTRFGGKTYYRLVNGAQVWWMWVRQT